MTPVASAAQVRELDRRLIEDVGVPGVALMETASRGIAASIVRHHATEARRGVVVVCGGGNNGGDGYGIARWLHGWGAPVAVWSLSDRSHGDAATMRAACARLGIPEVTGPGDAGLLVDAVFGTGLTREVTGATAQAIGAMAAHPAPVVAVDVPSGLDADTGAVLGVCAPAVRTVTVGRLKTGLFEEPAADLVGAVEVVDIGMDAVADAPVAERPDARDLAPLWPRRAPGDHKTRSGHLLVVAGSTEMAGAAVLTCLGALAAGVGLLTLLAPRGALPRLGALPPEVMVRVSGPGDRCAPPQGADARATAIAAGPGLGGGAPLTSELQAWLRKAWEESPLPMVYDADALSCAVGAGPGERVVTPHPGEAARLLGGPVGSRFEAAARLAGAGRADTGLAGAGRAALLKGRHTLVAQAGFPASINPTGHPVLATGGTGDVLTGVVGTLLARGATARDAARLAAFVHGRAGERLASRRSQGWSAADVAREIPAAVEELVS